MNRNETQKLSLEKPIAQICDFRSYFWTCIRTSISTDVMIKFGNLFRQNHCLSYLRNSEDAEQKKEKWRALLSLAGLLGYIDCSKICTTFNRCWILQKYNGFCSCFQYIFAISCSEIMLATIVFLFFYICPIFSEF